MWVAMKLAVSRRMAPAPSRSSRLLRGLRATLRPQQASAHPRISRPQPPGSVDLSRDSYKKAAPAPAPDQNRYGGAGAQGPLRRLPAVLEGVKDAKGKARTSTSWSSACARARACLRLPVLIKRWPPWPVWGKEGQSGWEGQSKRGTGWTRGGGGLSKWCAG
jgi:hypothetical protein